MTSDKNFKVCPYHKKKKKTHLYIPGNGYHGSIRTYSNHLRSPVCWSRHVNLSRVILLQVKGRSVVNFLAQFLCGIVTEKCATKKMHVNRKSVWHWVWEISWSFSGFNMEILYWLYAKILTSGSSFHVKKQQSKTSQTFRNVCIWHEINTGILRVYGWWKVEKRVKSFEFIHPEISSFWWKTLNCDLVLTTEQYSISSGKTDNQMQRWACY